MRIIAGFKWSFSSKITRNLHSGVQIVHSASSLALYAKSFPCLEFLAHRSPWQSQPVKLEEPYQLRKPNLPAGSVTGCATCIAKNTQQVTIRTNFMSLTDLSTSGLSALHSHSISTWNSSQSCSGPWRPCTGSVAQRHNSVVQSFSDILKWSTGTTWLGPTWTSRSIGNHERRSKRKYVIQYLAWRNEGWIAKGFWDGIFPS